MIVDNLVACHHHRNCPNQLALNLILPAAVGDGLADRWLGFFLGTLRRCCLPRKVSAMASDTSQQALQVYEIRDSNQGHTDAN